MGAWPGNCDSLAGGGVRDEVHHCQRNSIPNGFVWSNSDIQWQVKLDTEVFSPALSQKIHAVEGPSSD